MCTVTGKLINVLLCRGTVHGYCTVNSNQSCGLGWAESSPVESRSILFLGWFRPIFLLGRVWPIQKVFFKDVFKKSVIFCKVVFLYYKDTSPVWKYPVFVETSKKNIKWKLFCFPAYGQYPNIVFTFFVYKKQIFEVLKMCFRMDFLNTTKIIFLAFLDFTTCL
jgi:hypothetical protein